MTDAQPRFFNRELSWLAFNERVLEEAGNLRHPLLERLRFLSISGTNLDEFFMVRVAGLMGQQLRGVEEIAPDGMTVAQQLAAVTGGAHALLADGQAMWERLCHELRAADIAVLGPGELSAEERDWLAEHFADAVAPALTPQALDPAHPFPFIVGGGLGLLFELRREGGERLQQLVVVPTALPRFIRLPGASARCLSIENVLRLMAARMFPGFAVEGAAAFRILRDSDLEIEDEAEDLVRTFQSAIKRRRRGRVVLLELEADAPPALAAALKERLASADAVVAETAGFLGLGALAGLVEEDRPELKFLPYQPRFPQRVRDYDGDCFAAIGAKDIIVHHPYESFDVVLAFLRQAAADPDVIAIKQTLYRAGKQPTVVRALCDAAEAGKSVTAVVELKARFDEEQNLLWAAQLERAGVQVVYGFIDWKTHAKVSMVVRREGASTRTYCHFGTGNYHPVTARQYVDLSFFTADARAGRDAQRMFNYVTGYVEPTGLELVTLSPIGLRAALLDRIDAEIANVRAGRGAGIWAKMNALVDATVIEKLYEASAAGVPVELVVRGICCLRPGVPGLSETIRVKSIVGRFLEHERIWAFGAGDVLPSPQARVFMSSADWMPRNFDRRVEYMLPIENPTVHQQVLEQVLVANLLDTEGTWWLGADGRYRRDATPPERGFNLHRYFMTNPSLSGRGEGDRADVPALVERLRA